MASLWFSSSSEGSDGSSSYSPKWSSLTPDTSEDESFIDKLSISRVRCRLPLPFIPPSLSRRPAPRPRPLPLPLGLPRIPKDAACNVVDSQDNGTPDDWIPRDSRLVRLTGKHPFNAEARLKDIFSQGFLTPSNLFFVRNHGPVPRIEISKAEQWTIDIHGLCENPITLSVQDLKTMFKVVTIPVTLVCAGNRRKEQNVVQKSMGFSWGSSAISTALFTGVWLADVIDSVAPSKGARHVIFEGSDSLPHGPYGTSQLLSWARDRRRGMMLAWGMNGLPLEPDHGFPLRLVVPGQIGGRSVKWLRRVEFSREESQHHLHFHDNKLLPTSVGPVEAQAQESWWHDPRYIIRELNVNSVIACPNHEEVVDTSVGSYTVRGYAYSGGGKRITRVEVTLDDGESWELANIHYVEDQFREFVQFDSVYGDLDLTESDQCFCWCFWSLDIPLERLQTASSIAVRAMDESLALQPKDMYWTATGMMNNWWFRVQIRHLQEGKLLFEHPAPVGTKNPGWMQNIKDQGQDPAHPKFSITKEENAKPKRLRLVVTPKQMIRKPDIKRLITMEELKIKSTSDKPWFVIQGEVYDATTYLHEHPGGRQAISLVAGQDATEDFMAIHSPGARQKLAEYHIGTLIRGGDGSTSTQPGQLETSILEKSDSDDQDDGSACFLHSRRWKSISLVRVDDVSKDTKQFRFALDRSDRELGLPVGQHVHVRIKTKTKATKRIRRAPVGEREPITKFIQRAYTPISQRTDKGFIDLLVKIYYPNAQHPKGGQMTQELANLKPGETVEIKGPIGEDFTWLCDNGGADTGMPGAQLNTAPRRRIRHLGMVCGGSGVTPILQLSRGILFEDHNAVSSLSVVDVNRTFEDILCKNELDALAMEFPSRFKVRYSLTGSASVPEGWKHSLGRVDLEMLREHLPHPSCDALVCVCGPPGMEKAVKASLIQLGWDEKSQIVMF